MGKLRPVADCDTGMDVAFRLLGRAGSACGASGRFEEERGCRSAEAAGESGHRSVKKEGLVLLGVILGVVTVGGGCASRRWSGWAKGPGRAAAHAVEGPFVAPFPMRAGARLLLYGAQAVCHVTGGHFEPGPASEAAVEEIDGRLRAELRDAGLETVSRSSLAEWLARAEPEALFDYEASLGAQAALALNACEEP